ncbi:MAG TPA: hypothetical protein ACFYEK_17740 [Candidatus Wunengus sp. YC60]|uniref:hypothetical protein n=1 Tax=Candidatus Wunengus sp. YC60 TaxID=3367697 RepID=UPI00402817EB
MGMEIKIVITDDQAIVVNQYLENNPGISIEEISQAKINDMISDWDNMQFNADVDQLSNSVKNVSREMRSMIKQQIQTLLNQKD